MKKSYLTLIGLILAITIQTQALAIEIDLNFVDIATASDGDQRNRQDGVFDLFNTINLGSVNNNGYNSFRTAFELDMSLIPNGSTINSAILTLVVGTVEGTRQISLNGYAGDGTISLNDFSLGYSVDTETLNPLQASQTVQFDVADYINMSLAWSERYVGFNLREEERAASSPNYTVLFFSVDGYSAPVLSVDYDEQNAPVPEPATFLLLGGGLAGLAFYRRKENKVKHSDK